MEHDHGLWRRYQDRDEKRLYALAAALAVIVAALLSLASYCYGQEPTVENQAEADLQREAEWLALEADFYDRATLEPKKSAVDEIKKALSAIRSSYPEVKDIKVPEELTLDLSIQMNIANVSKKEELPAEVTELIDQYKAAYTIQYGENDGDPVCVYIYFHKMLHAPSLVAAVSRSPRVTNAKPEDAPKLPVVMNNVQIKKQEEVWQFTFVKVSGDPESQLTFEHYYFTATPNLAWGLLNMSVAKIGEYSLTVSADGTTLERGEKKW